MSLFLFFLLATQSSHQTGVLVFLNVGTDVPRLETLPPLPRLSTTQLTAMLHSWYRAKMVALLYPPTTGQTSLLHG